MRPVSVKFPTKTGDVDGVVDLDECTAHRNEDVFDAAVAMGADPADMLDWKHFLISINDELITHGYPPKMWFIQTPEGQVVGMTNDLAKAIRATS